MTPATLVAELRRHGRPIATLLCICLLTACDLSLPVTNFRRPVEITAFWHPIHVGDTVHLSVEIEGPSRGDVINPVAPLRWSDLRPRIVELLTSPDGQTMRVVARSPGIDSIRVELGDSTVLQAEPLVAPIRVHEAWSGLSVGHDHGCAHSYEGYVHCWGRGGSGAIGGGQLTNAVRPTPALGNEWAGDVGSGREHTCAVSGQRTWCWGSNGWGQLGITGVSMVTRPEGVTLPAGFTSRSITAGDRHTCTSDNDGVLCWGDNSTGQLGRAAQPDLCPATGARTCSYAPLKVIISDVEVVDAGGAHTCAVTTQYVASCWGANQNGQLGIGNLFPKAVFSVRRVEGDLLFTRISAGEEHTCAITPSGRAFCWGSNRYGQLGIGTATLLVCEADHPCAARPMEVAGGLTFAEISAGKESTCGITTAGELYCWGRGDAKQLATASLETLCDGQPCLRAPRRASDTRYRQVSMGASHGCAVTPRREIYCWGRNDAGQHGKGYTSDDAEQGFPVMDPP